MEDTLYGLRWILSNSDVSLRYNLLADEVFDSLLKYNIDKENYTYLKCIAW